MRRKDYYNYFTRKKRISTDEIFVCLKDDAPEELNEFIRKVHKDYFYTGFPNDWVYEVMYEAFCDLNENDLDDIKIDADDYTGDLKKWYEESYAEDFCVEAQEEGFTRDCAPALEIIEWGQWLAKNKIYHVVNEFILEDDEEEESDEEINE